MSRGFLSYDSNSLNSASKNFNCLSSLKCHRSLRDRNSSSPLFFLDYAFNRFKLKVFVVFSSCVKISATLSHTSSNLRTGSYIISGIFLIVKICSGQSKFHILFLFFVSSMFSISLCSLLCYHIHLVLNNRNKLHFILNTKTINIWPANITLNIFCLRGRGSENISIYD